MNGSILSFVLVKKKKLILDKDSKRVKSLIRGPGTIRNSTINSRVAVIVEESKYTIIVIN